MIAAGGKHGCGIRTDGTATCWGDNTDGQTNVPPGVTFTAITAGTSHSCGIETNGTATCWGNTADGRTSVPPGERFTAITAGAKHSCGIRTDNTATCWGDNTDGQAAAPQGERFTAITAGAAHTCGIKTDGTASCWGASGNGRSAVPAGARFTAITAGAAHTCGIKTDGTASCWGDNAYGQTNAPSGEHFTAITAGAAHTCGIKTDGNASCWGTDADGQTEVPPGITFTAITAGASHGCGIKTNGTVSCWGSSADERTIAPPGQFGYGQIEVGEVHSCGLKTNGTAVCWGYNYAGQAAVPADTQFTVVSAGNDHSCGIRTDGTATCWGDNTYGQTNAPPGERFTALSVGAQSSCGIRTDGTATCWGASYYGQTNVPPGVTFTAVSVGLYGSCGLKTDGTAVCWGDDSYGKPMTVPPGLELTAITSSGQLHNCGIRTDGTAVCWGDNTYGQTNAPPIERFSAISAGRRTSCGIRADGTAVCWGDDFGGTITPPTDEHFTAISVGVDHVCGIKTDGATLCWGNDLYGQLGGAPRFISAPPAAAVPQGPYTHRFQATPRSDSYGNGSTTYRVTDGQLPPGLTLDAATGELSGTPTEEGAFSGTVTASNAYFAPDATQAFSFTVDITPPATPTLTASDPTSPSRVQTPRLIGTAEPGTTVQIYSNSSCTRSEAMGSAATFASPGLWISFGLSNRTTTFFATATDAVGNVSDCSKGLTYVSDQSPPLAPTLNRPASPSRELSPMLTGKAEADSTVRIYTGGNCTGIPVVTGAASALAAPGLQVTVVADSNTTFSATATDKAGNVSTCSAGVTYVNDRTPPAVPVLGRLDPASPGTALTVRITGQTEYYPQVRIYTTDTCTGAPAATGSATQFASPGLAVTVAADATTTLYATATDDAGNVSACSTGLSYRNDRTAPDAPALTGTSPASPAQSLTPRILGAAEPGSTVRVYDDASCTGTPLATGSAGDLASPGLQVTVGSEKTTRLYATATDQVGNVSACSGALAYRNDRTAPDTPILLRTDPAPPAQSLTPRVVGSAEPGATVQIYGNANCSGAPLTTGAADAFADSGLIVTVTADRTTTFSATATDEAGNVSLCTTTGLAYRNDHTPPPAPTLWINRTSPGTALEIRILGEAEGESTVRVYANESCAGRPLATLTASKLAELGLAETVSANSSNRYSATATDQVGNVSGCSQPVSYTHRPDPVPDPPLVPDPPTAPTPPTVPTPPSNPTPPSVPGPQPEPSPTTCMTGKLTLTTLTRTGSGRRERLLVAGLADPAFAGQKLTVSVQDRPGAKARPAGSASVSAGGSYQLTIAAPSGRKAAKSRYLVQLANGVKTAAREPDRGVVLRSQKIEQNGQVRITATLPASKPGTAVRIQREIACQAGRTTVATVKTNGKRQIAATLPAVEGQAAIYHLSGGGGRATLTVPAR